MRIRIGDSSCTHPSPARAARRHIGLAVCLVVAGCSVRSSNFTGAPAVPSSPSPPVSAGSSQPSCHGGDFTNITQPSIYLINATSYPNNSVLVLPRGASGDTPPLAEFPGSLVSLDGSGNAYVLSNAGDCIAEYPVNATTGTTRFLPVGPGTKISKVENIAVSRTGEIFVADGVGIAVFSATASGNASPERYIIPSIALPYGQGPIAVDDQDNLYMIVGPSMVAEFGPTDTGSVFPYRIINTGGLGNLAIATDSAGNLYVESVFLDESAGVLEFGPQANGNAAPVRTVTSPAMCWSYCGGPGIAVDSAGVLYFAGGTATGTQTIFEFAANASGSVAPINTVTSSPGGWFDTLNSSIAVH